ncbi:MAG: hypothetical protein ABIQ15_08400 [Nocardioides sp.]
MQLSARLARVLPISLLVALAPWRATMNDEDDCPLLSECLSQDADQLVVLLVLVPVAWVALRLLRVPRSALVSLVAAVLGFVGWRLVRDAQHAGVLPPELGPPPLWSVLLVALVAGLVAAPAVGPGPGPVLLRLCAPALLVASLWPVSQLADASAAGHEAEEIRATGLTTYRPVIAGEGPRSASLGRDGVFLGYTISSGSDIAYPHVRLLPTSDRDLCQALAVFPEDCTSDGTTMRSDGGGLIDVAVVRGDTTLHASYLEVATLGPEAVIEALRTAPVVDAAELLR